MRALIGRGTDGWSTRGLAARLEGGQLLTAASAEEMIRQLRAVGVDEIAVSGSDDGDRALSTTLQQLLLDAWQQATSEEPEDRFGMPESAFRAARGSHGLDNPTIRSGTYVPTRREVAGKAPEWLCPVLIDWMWESRANLIPKGKWILCTYLDWTPLLDIFCPVVTVAPSFHTASAGSWSSFGGGQGG